MHPIESFNNRFETYRNAESAWRSFYKWVCKMELYGRLKVAGYFKERPFYERGPEKFNFGHQFRRGYPDFNATRSEARKQWENQFSEAKRRLTDEFWAEDKRKFYDRFYGRERLRTMTPAARHFFRTMDAISKIKKHVETR